MTSSTLPSLDFDRCYAALSARDRRFDGQFIVAVHSTGIYCRPSCPARTPQPANVDFVPTAAAAQQQGFRACRRCHPDAVPGSPLWNVRSDLASRAMRLIGDGVMERGGVDALAAELGYSARQVNRVLTAELGAGPQALARAHRATNARVLIDNTDLPMSEIAFAAGFDSVRQFNDTVREVFATTPTDLRSRRRRPAQATQRGMVRLRLPVRQPFSPEWLLWFLGAHAIAGLEAFDVEARPHYRRALSLPRGPGTVGLEMAADHVTAELHTHDLRDLPTAVHRIRHFLDLDADSVAVEEALRRDPDLAPLVTRRPGIRAPGATDGLETLIRTMVGQQISLAAARTHGARLVAALGQPLDPPRPPGAVDTTSSFVTRCFPTAEAIAEHGLEVLRGPRRRMEAIVAVARAVAEGSLDLNPATPSEELRAQLLAQPGIGRWTADYLVLRLLGDPDVLLDTDLILVRSAARLGIDLSDSQRWAPWRSYVSMHLWHDALRTTEPILAPQRQ